MREAPEIVADFAPRSEGLRTSSGGLTMRASLVPVLFASCFLLAACATGSEVSSNEPIGGGGSDSEEEAGTGGKGGTGGTSSKGGSAGKGGSSAKGGSSSEGGTGGSAGSQSGGASGGKATLKGGAAGAAGSATGGYAGKGGNVSKGGSGGKGGKGGASGSSAGAPAGEAGEGGAAGEPTAVAGAGGTETGTAGSGGSGSSETGGASAAGGSGSVDCSRDVCVEGSALAASCSPEHALVCDLDAYCCDPVEGEWDDRCAAYGGAAVGCDGKQGGLAACFATYEFKVYKSSCKKCVDDCVVKAGYDTTCDYEFFDAEYECNDLCYGDPECFCGCAALLGYGQFPAGCTDAEDAPGCCVAASKAYACAADSCKSACQ